LFLSLLIKFLLVIKYCYYITQKKFTHLFQETQIGTKTAPIKSTPLPISISTTLTKEHVQKLDAWKALFSTNTNNIPPPPPFTKDETNVLTIEQKTAIRAYVNDVLDKNPGGTIIDAPLPNSFPTPPPQSPHLELSSTQPPNTGERAALGSSSDLNLNEQIALKLSKRRPAISDDDDDNNDTHKTKNFVALEQSQVKAMGDQQKFRLELEDTHEAKSQTEMKVNERPQSSLVSDNIRQNIIEDTKEALLKRLHKLSTIEEYQKIVKASEKISIEELQKAFHPLIELNQLHDNITQKNTQSKEYITYNLLYADQRKPTIDRVQQLVQIALEEAHDVSLVASPTTLQKPFTLQLNPALVSDNTVPNSLISQQEPHKAPSNRLKPKPNPKPEHLKKNSLQNPSPVVSPGLQDSIIKPESSSKNTDTISVTDQEGPQIFTNLHTPEPQAAANGLAELSNIAKRIADLKKAGMYIGNSTSEAGQNLLPTTSKPDISSPKIADTTQQEDYGSLLIKFHKKVAEHPDIQVNPNLSEDKKLIAIEIQSLAIGLSQELTPLRDAPGFIQKADGTYTITDSTGLDGPIFMSRIDNNGKQCVDSKNKPIFDILHYENGKLNEAKSFIAPDGVPPNSKPTIDPTIRNAVLEVHAKKEQARAILKQKASTIVKNVPYYSTAQKIQSRKASGRQI
jgi:hypothetical protein